MIVLQSITVLSVLCAVSSHAKHQYHLVYDRMNMADAVKYCREKYTDLATIDNMDDVKTLNDMADLSKMVISKGSYAAWIGLYEDVNSWRWSLADRHFYKDGETEFRKWLAPEPNNYKPGEHCTTIYSNGNWNDDPCDARIAAVCVDARGPNGTFVLIPNTMTWTEAQTYCREHHTDLASVRNETEHQKIINLIPGGQKVWIGLFRDTWKWSDGSDSSFRNWKQGEPYNKVTKEDCVVADLGQLSKWEDWNCDDIAAFICYSHVITKQVIRVRLVKKDSSLDLDDPAVMEDLLKQFKQRLIDKGVTGDVKLSWKKQSDGKVFRKEKKKDEL